MPSLLDILKAAQGNPDAMKGLGHIGTVMTEAKKKTVLIVDDEEAMRKYLRKILEKEFSVKVIEAADGEEAIDTMLRRGDEVSLVLLDVQMPRTNGAKVLATLRSRWTPEEKPVFICTVDSLPATVQKFVKLGISGFLLKPVSADTIKEKLIKFLEPLSAQTA